MGFRFRKSIKLPLGFRANVSKSGVGYSWGTKGYRVTKTARGTTRTTLSAPGTGLSYVEETAKGSEPENRPGCSGCLIKIIAVPLVLLLAFFIWFLVFREYEDPDPTPSSIQRTDGVTIIGEEQTTENKTARETGKNYLISCGYEIVEVQGFKFTVTLPALSGADLSTAPENWDDIRSDFSETSKGLFEKMGQTATVYLQDNSGNHYLTAVDGKETYNFYAVEPTPIPSAANGHQSSGASGNVWISDAGKRYHSSSSCSGMENPRLVTREDAIQKGYSACDKCY